MDKLNAREKKVYEQMKPQLDRILDVYGAKGYVEVVGTIGGDVHTFRVMDDGKIYEK